MKKNWLKILLGLLVVVLSFGMLAACGGSKQNDEEESDSEEIVEEIDTGYTVNGATADTLTVSNATKTLTFSDVVRVNDDFEYLVYLEPKGLTQAIETADLKVGENVFYVRVFNDSYAESNKLKIYRNQIFTVSFDLAGGEGEFKDLSIEEGEKLSPPETEPTRSGFIFKGWNYNFNDPVSKTFTIKAVWEQMQAEYKVKIEQTDDGETFIKNEEKSAQFDGCLGYVGSTVYADVPKINGYWYAESESEYFGEVEEDGSLELVLRYYRLIQVTGVVTVPSGNQSLTVAVYNDSGDFYQTFDEIKDGKIEICLEVPVSALEKTLNVKALGYSDTEMLRISNDDVTFNMIPKTYDFGAFTLNNVKYQSAKTEVATATTSAAATDLSTDWNTITTENGVIMQARGKSHAVLFSHFAEKEYAVSATVHTFTSVYSSGTLGTSYSARSGGFVIATAHDQMHVLITDKGSIWIGFGYMSGVNDVPNGELYMRGDASSAFVAYNPSEGAMPVTASGGYEMTLVRKDNAFTLYVGGIKYLTLDSKNGAVGYEHLATLTPVYVAGSTTNNETKFKARLSHFLASDMSNAVGLTTFRKTINADRGYTGAIFSDYRRTTDVDGEEKKQEQIRANAKKIVKSITLNGRTLNSTQLNGNTVRYASMNENLQFFLGKVTSGWIYDVEGKDLYCTYLATENLNTNHTVYVNDIQKGNFTFTFKGALAYRQGFVITDGTNRLALVGESASGGDLIRLCQDDNLNSTFLKGQGIQDENTVWKVEVTKGESIKIYLTNTVTGNQEKLAITITKTSLTTHVGTLNDGTTSLTNHNILGNAKGLLESTELACGFTFTSKSANRPSLTKVFKDVSITA